MAEWEIKGIKRFFSEVPTGAPVALINSFGFLEIAVNLGNASLDLGVQKGSRVNVNGHSCKFTSIMMQCNARENLTKTEPNKAKVLVLTTSYPSHEEDPSGVFIAKLLAAIHRRGYSIKVVAPSDGTFYGRRKIGGIETVRFGYFWPRSLERLTRGARRHT